MICFRNNSFVNSHNNKTEIKQSFVNFKGRHACRFDGFAKVVGSKFVLYYGGDSTTSVADFKHEIKYKNKLEFYQIKCDNI